MGKSYPTPAAEYRQLVENPQLFSEILRKFHSSFGTQFTSPCIGGIPVDLHRLFVEVTSRGGLDLVIRDRKWEEVISAFKSEISNVKGSFCLRKCYLSLLYHFEQAYYFRKTETTAVVNDAANQIPGAGSTVESTRIIPFQGSLQLQPGFSLVGVIDEKFDNGYVVSVNVGSDKLKGILYHIPDGPQPTWSPEPNVPQRQKRKKSRLSSLDSSKVKPTSNTNDFFTEPHASPRPLPLPQRQEKSLDQNTENLWNNSSEAEKQYHQDKEDKNTERDETEMIKPSVGS